MGQLANVAGRVEDVDATTAKTVIAGEAGYKLSLKSVFIACAAAAIVQIVDGDGNVIWPNGAYPANGGIAVGDLTRGLHAAAEGKAIMIHSSTGDDVSCVIEAYKDKA